MHCLFQFTEDNVTFEFPMLFQLAEIMSGDFDEVLDSWRLVDCRYPYEYINGHLLVRTITTNYISLFVPEQFTVKAHPASFVGERGEPKNEALFSWAVYYEGPPSFIWGEPKK